MTVFVPSRSIGVVLFATLVLQMTMTSFPVLAFARQSSPTTRTQHEQQRKQQQRRPLADLKTTSSSTASKTQLHLSEGLALVNDFVKAKPMIAAFCAGGAQACLADWMAQTRERWTTTTQSASSASSSLTKPFSLARNISFLLFGGLYQGCTNEFLFNTCFPIWFGSGTGLSTVLTKVVFTMTVLGPFASLPTAYTIKGLLVHKTWKGVTQYWNDICHQGLLIKFWSVWTPVNIINFSLVPVQWRVPFNSLIAFVWLTILSTVSSRSSSSTTTTTTPTMTMTTPTPYVRALHPSAAT